MVTTHSHVQFHGRLTVNNLHELDISRHGEAVWLELLAHDLLHLVSFVAEEREISEPVDGIRNLLSIN